jgi:hypothetical protein
MPLRHKNRLITSIEHGSEGGACNPGTIVRNAAFIVLVRRLPRRTVAVMPSCSLQLNGEDLAL